MTDRGNIQIETITVTCGRCREAVDGSVSGSHLWDADDVAAALCGCGRYCHGCGRDGIIPLVRIGSYFASRLSAQCPRCGKEMKIDR